MRKSIIALVLGVFAVCVVTVPRAYAAKDFLHKNMRQLIDGGNTVLEIRHCKDNSYDIVYLNKDKKIVMIKRSKHGQFEMTPLKTYDLSNLPGRGA